MREMFPFKIALNTSTLFPFKLNVIEQIRVAREAGYEGIELWMQDIEAYLEGGGTIQDIKSALEETNIEFINAIAFFKWTDVDAETRSAAFDQAEKEMQLLYSLGCKYIAAPPFGDVSDTSLDEMARHFEQLVHNGRQIGVEPILEFWGKAKKLSTLDEARYVLNKSNIPDGKMLLDPFHMYVGGSNLAGLKSLKGDQIGVFHLNDYPNSPGKEEITDQDRVFPGEGVSPTHHIAEILNEIQYDGYLSLELFIEDFKGKSAVEVAEYGLNSVRNSYSI
ncbi:sugar phosphate isomerase/epimerase family protein [Lederbergia panacisoli]|uniref:sugar phosphate isomerase/epimerase family protein n=1 Tax=Lederbergia panacisoli TaxID=1255251 RepID=UPI00214BF674|nr:sugar phosphate isomerase/epimerase family protein [Lederbergia panacisoli]MCR2821131.1 sugar phosphate isomerase/epimerase [Lederbergia panacisoli]